MIKIFLAVLLVLTAYFAYEFLNDYIKTYKNNKIEKSNFAVLGVIGFIACFFDTLGIGCFAIITGFLRNFKLSKDRVLPGTLNVSSTIPIVVEALIFMTVIEVEPITLFSMIISAAVGAILGAGIVSKLDEKKIQLSMGAALLLVALLMLAGQLKLMPVGGVATGLTGFKLVIAIVGNFILGALMTLGIGLYAPCMALVFALGMSPKIAFPIMMGSCAFLMPFASAKFIKEGAYDRKASLAIALFGSIGVLIAAYIVKSLPIKVLTWVVIVVIVYTSFSMFKSGMRKKKI